MSALHRRGRRDCIQKPMYPHAGRNPGRKDAGPEACRSLMLPVTCSPACRCWWRTGGSDNTSTTGAPPAAIRRRRPLPRAERRRKKFLESYQCGERCAQGGKSCSWKGTDDQCKIVSSLSPLALEHERAAALLLPWVLDGIRGIGHRAVVGSSGVGKATACPGSNSPSSCRADSKMKGHRLLSTEDKHALM